MATLWQGCGEKGAVVGGQWPVVRVCSLHTPSTHIVGILWISPSFILVLS